VTEPEASASIEPLRLRARRPQVTRLCRKVLLSLGVVVTAGIAPALIFALAPHQVPSSTSNRTTPDGLANLPRAPARRFPARPAFCQAISASRSPMRALPRQGCRLGPRPRRSLCPMPVLNVI
jgi:hypothetical protein